MKSFFCADCETINYNIKFDITFEIDNILVSWECSECCQTNRHIIPTYTKI